MNIRRWRRFSTVPAIVLAALAAFSDAVAHSQSPSQSGTSAGGLFHEVSGSGEPLVFVHAFSVDRRMWDPQVAAFHSRFRIVRYDLRGHGLSAAPTEPYTGFEDLHGVLDAARVEKATLVGLSAGSELAINFAIAYPDRVARLILAAPGLGGYTLPRLDWFAPVMEALTAGDSQRAAKLWAETPIMAMRSNLAAAPIVTSLVMSNAKLWTYKRTERPLSPPAVGRLGEIKCPTLIIVGDQDLPHVQDVARVLSSGIAGAKLVTIPGAGHIVNLDATGPFNEAIAAFLGHR